MLTLRRDEPRGMIEQGDHGPLCDWLEDEGATLAQMPRLYGDEGLPLEALVLWLMRQGDHKRAKAVLGAKGEAAAIAVLGGNGAIRWVSFHAEKSCLVEFGIGPSPTREAVLYSVVVATGDAYSHNFPLHVRPWGTHFWFAATEPTGYVFFNWRASESTGSGTLAPEMAAADRRRQVMALLGRV